MNKKFFPFILVLCCACSGSVQNRDVPKADTHAPYVPPRDSGLQPPDSSAYHTDTSIQHTQ